MKVVLGVVSETTAGARNGGARVMMDAAAFFKVAIIKSKEVLVLLQTLDVVNHALGEIPDISGIELLCS